jgi:hypothetical protein
MASMVKPTWILLPLLALGCAPGKDDDGNGGSDLPTGWESAERISGLTQAECDGDPYGDTGSGDFDEHATFEGGVGAVQVVYNDAHFRCAQDVEAFARRSEGTLDVLVQPIDMDPDAVAGCDCLYDITMEITDLPAGDLAVSLSRRWDNINDPNDPVEITTATVTVE